MSGVVNETDVRRQPRLWWERHTPIPAAQPQRPAGFDHDNIACHRPRRTGASTYPTSRREPTQADTHKN